MLRVIRVLLRKNTATSTSKCPSDPTHLSDPNSTLLPSQKLTTKIYLPSKIAVAARKFLLLAKN